MGRAALWMIGLMVVGLPEVSTAQSVQLPAFELERLQLDPFGVGSLVLGGGQLLPAGSLRLSALGHYQRNPLLISVGGQRAAAVVGDRLTTELLFGVGVHRRVELGFGLPIVVAQTSDDLAAYRIQRPAERGVGSPMVAARVGLLQSAEDDALDLALEARVGIPIFGNDALTGSGTATFLPRLILSKEAHPLLLSMEAGALLGPAVRFGPQQLGNELFVGAALSTIGSVVRGEVSWRSSLSLAGLPSAHQLLGGGRVTVGGLEIFALGGPGIGTAVGSPEYRVLMGVALGLGFERDAAGRSGVAQDAGTLAPPVDANVPSPAEPPPKEPDSMPLRVPEDPCRSGVVPRPPYCPDISQDVKGLPASNPDEAVVLKPAKEPVAIARDRLVTKEKVQFKNRKAALLAKSQRLLDQVARVIVAHPELGAISVEAHTEDVGDAAANRALSLARANSVRKYLMHRGVSPSMLKAKGYGPDRPLETNMTARGREANRRVEFIIEKPVRSEPDLIVPLVPKNEQPPGKEER